MNRARILLTTLLRIQALLLAPSAFGTELTISIDGIRSADGRLMVAVLGSESAFEGKAPAAVSVLLPPRNGQVSFSTDALETGEYAVRVMHDENGNGEMDNNLVGMPVEPWGFSNNAVGNFGPPGWQDAFFSIDDDTSITIDLNH